MIECLHFRGAYFLRSCFFVPFCVACQVILVFSSLTWLLVGSSTQEFSTLEDAWKSVTRISLGESENFYPQILAAQPTVGPVVVVLYQVLGIVLLLNVVIAILLEVCFLVLVLLVFVLVLVLVLFFAFAEQVYLAHTFLFNEFNECMSDEQWSKSGSSRVYETTTAIARHRAVCIFSIPFQAYRGVVGGMRGEDTIFQSFVAFVGMTL